jgi:N-acetylglutamate synthase-like GNAT family acetyltransferase
MIKIKYLCEYPNHLTKVAQLWYDTIGKTWRPDAFLSQVENSFREHLNKDALPLMYIALDGDKVVGMCALRTNDGIKSKYIPWLGSLCVDPEYRKRGIGKLLIKMVKEKAHKMGFHKIYLFTFEKETADWYGSNGWHKIEDTTYNDLPVIVMNIEV